MKANERVRILAIGHKLTYSAPYIKRFEIEGIPIKVDFLLSPRSAVRCKNPLDYNIGLLHGSDNINLSQDRNVTDWLKSKNPEMIIIGASTGGFFRGDRVVEEDYHETFELDEKFYTNLRNVLIKYGFIEQEVVA